METGLNNLTNIGGLSWIRNNLGETSISVGFDKDNFKNQLAFGYIPGIGSNPHVVENTVFLPFGFTSMTWSTPGGGADTMVAHELGHVIDNRSSNSGLGSILGGGISDALMGFVGGVSTDPFGIRCTNNSLKFGNAQTHNQFISGNGYEYGNNSPADYFAQMFSAVIMTPHDSHIPATGSLCMAVYIDLTKSR